MIQIPRQTPRSKQPMINSTATDPPRLLPDQKADSQIKELVTIDCHLNCTHQRITVTVLPRLETMATFHHLYQTNMVLSQLNIDLLMRQDLLHLLLRAVAIAILPFSHFSKQSIKMVPQSCFIPLCCQIDADNIQEVALLVSKNFVPHLSTATGVPLILIP